MNSNLGPLEFEWIVNNPAIMAQLRQTENLFQNANRNIQNTVNTSSASIDGFAKKAALAATGYFSVNAAQNFVAELVKVRGEFEQLHIAYDTILKSKEKGDALFAETVKLAATTPFTLSEVAKSTKQLLAYGFGAEEVTGVLTKLGNVAAGVSAPIGDIAYLYGTLKTQGRAYAQDIRQFTGRGIPIIEELAKQFKTTQENVNGLVEAGKVGFPQIEKAFTAMTGSGGQFFNLMEKQSKSLTGQISNLSDAFDIMLNEIGENNDDILKGTVAGLATVVKNYKEVISILELLIITYGAYRTALIATSALEGFKAIQKGTEVIMKFNGAMFVATGATKSLTVAQTLQTVATNIQTKALAYLRSEAFLTATALGTITAAIAIVGASVYAWVEASEALNAAQKSFNEIAKTTSDALVSEKTKTADLIAIAKDHNNSLAQRADAVAKLNQISPQYLGNITLETIGTRETIKAIDEYLTALDRKLQGEAAYAAKLENTKRINDLKTRGKDAIGTSEYAGLAIQDVAEGLIPFDGKSGIFEGGDRAQALVNKLIASYEAANTKINQVYGQQIKDNLATGIKATDAQIEQALLFQKRLNDVITNGNELLKTSTGKKDFEAIQKKLSDALDIPGISLKKINQIKDLQTKVEQALSVYSRKTDKKLADQEESEQKRRNAIYDKIGALNEAALQNSLTDDQKEVAQAKAKYDAILKEIDRFNKNKDNKTKINPANVVINGVVTDLPKAKQAAVDDVDAKQKVEKLKVVIEQQKSIFDAFEAYKLDAGEKAATELYSKNLKGFKTYVEYLKSFTPKEGDASAAANATRDMLAKMLPAARNDEERKQEEQFAALLLQTQTYEQKRAAIIEEYENNVTKLRSKNKLKEAAQLTRDTEEKLTAIESDKIESLDAYKELYDGLHNLSLARSKEDLVVLDKYIKKWFTAGEITEDTYLKFKKLFKDTEASVNDELPEGLLAISSHFSEIANQVSSFDEGLGKALNTVGGLIAGAASIKKNLTALGDIGKSGKSNPFGTITSSLGLLGSAIGIVTGVVELFSNSKKKAEQAKYAQDLQLKATEAVNKALERQLAITKQLYGPERISGYKKSIADITKAQLDAQNQINSRLQLTGTKFIDDLITKFNNGEVLSSFNGNQQFIDDLLASGKLSLVNKPLEDLQKLLDSGRLDERTAALVQSLVQLKEQARDTLNALNEEITGINFDSLNDSIKAVFDSGEITVEKFADAIEKSIRGAFSNAFKRNEIEKAMQPFYDQLYQAGLDGTYTQQEIDTLRKSKEAIAASLAERAKIYQEIIGKDVDPADSKTNDTLAGQIKGITADQANILEGSIHGMQLAIVRTNDILMDVSSTQHAQLAEMKQQTILQMRIAAYTGRTADNTDLMRDSLKNIDNNTSGSFATALRAAGKYGY